MRIFIEINQFLSNALFILKYFTAIGNNLRLPLFDASVAIEKNNCDPLVTEISLRTNSSDWGASIFSTSDSALVFPHFTFCNAAFRI